MNRRRSIIVLTALLICGLFCGCRSAKHDVIRIAVAANMQYTVEALLKEYAKQADTKFEVVVGASGKLTQQIIHGAPFALLISADSSYPLELEKQGLAAAAPKAYAKGILVLWTANKSLQLADWKSSLLDSRIKHIALPNPKTAPYGEAAELLLQRSGLYDQLQHKLATAESISQASQFVASGNADIGFTAKSIVLSAAMRNIGTFVEIPEALYPPIVQSAVLLVNKQSSETAAARSFYDFLYSDKAKEILVTFGYKEP